MITERDTCECGFTVREQRPGKLINYNDTYPYTLKVEESTEDRQNGLR